MACYVKPNGSGYTIETHIKQSLLSSAILPVLYCIINVSVEKITKYLIFRELWTDFFYVTFFSFFSLKQKQALSTKRNLKKFENFYYLSVVAKTDN